MTYINDETMELITIEQLPIVAERFSQMVEPVRQRVAEILSMECNEETKAAVKAERASLRKFRDDMKSAVRAKKSELFAPWMQVESEINRIDVICADADRDLKDKIDSVESEEKHRKELELRGYFYEKCDLRGLNWLEFERMGLKIRLSDSMKALYAAVDAFVDRIFDEVEVILGMEGRSEVFAEYKKCLNLSAAVEAVVERKKETAAAAETIGILNEAQVVAKEKAEELEKAIKSTSEGAKLSAPVCSTEAKSEPVQTATSSDKRYTAEFKVNGTIEQLRALKKFIIDNGIEILE